MKITLVRGTEKAEIEGDDELIKQSLSYQGTFERSVKLIKEGFYATAKPTEPEA